MKITKDKLIKIIWEELNEVRPLRLQDPWSQGTSGGEEVLRDLAYQSTFGRKGEEPVGEIDPTGAFQELLDDWQPETEEGQQYKDDLENVLKSPIRENQSRFTKVSREELQHMLAEGNSDVLSNLYKWCRAGTKCSPGSTRTKWWKGR